MIKLGKASLRGEIIRPVCKCKLLRNFLPSPPFRARYFWQIFRERECGQVSANVREEDREIFKHVCENLKLRVTRVTRENEEIESRQEERRSHWTKNWSSTVRRSTQRYRREKRKIEKQAKRAQPSRMADYHKCHYPSNPSATESMRNKESVGQ